jgi:large subunit ribosomal protein L25
MAESTLVAEVGRPTGSRPARRLRREGRIPAVVYGHGVDPLAVTVDGRELRTVLSGDVGVNALLSLDIAGRRYSAMTREIQRHPVRHTVLHVDFQVVDPEEVTTVDVPLVVVGEAVEVGHEDGLVDQLLFSLTIQAKPDAIPMSVEVDQSGLRVGGAVKVGDLKLPPGVSTELDPDTIVVHGIPGRVQGPEEAAEAEGTEAEGS